MNKLITPAQRRVYTFIAANPHTSPGAIVAALNLRPSEASGIIQALKRRGLVGYAERHCQGGLVCKGR